MINLLDDVSDSIKRELEARAKEVSGLERLELEQHQLGTSAPTISSSLSRFVANPSTVSVETYKRMLDTDETIGSGIDFLNLALISRFGDYKHPDPSIQKFVRRALEQMEGSLHENLDEMLSAEWSGFSITEQVWAFKEDFDGVPAFVPQRLVTYAPLTMVFAVDRQGEVLPDGIYQYQRYANAFTENAMFSSRGGDLDGFRPDLYAAVGDYPYPIRISADLSYLTVKLPKDKVIHLRSSSTGKFNNPYGRSILRRVYKNWVMKDAFLKMWLVAADRKGTPLVVGYASANDTVMSQVQDETYPVQGELPRMPRGERADQALARIMRSIHNSSFIVLPGAKGETYELEAIQIQGDMSVFKDGIDYFNRAIMRGLLIPALVMSSGDGSGSYALGQEHHKIFQRVIDGKLKVYKEAILEQFVKKIIAYNFPRDQWEKHGLGEFAMDEHDTDNMEKLANIFQILTEQGYMTTEAQEDMDFVRQKMGVPKGMAQVNSPTIDPQPMLDPEKQGIPVSEEASDELPPNYRI